MANMLGAARLSHSTDSSTSVERQTEQIQHTAAARGDTLVHVTEDVDVSGAVSPFERDDLGPWLTEPEKIAQWDVLCIAKLDRLTRSIAHFVAVVEWCQANGKTIVSIGDSFDLGTPVGRMVAHILALFAQFERERMAERRKDHTRKAMSQAHWDGRAVAPGYRPVKVGDHWELEPDESKAATINAMAAAIIAGKSARQVGTQHGMDSKGVLSILRNQSLRGYVMHDGQPVRGEDGLPVTREAILPDETWTKLQAQLDRNSATGSGSPTKAGSAAMLLGVAECGHGHPLYMQRRAAGNRYRHRDGVTCACGSFTAQHLEAAMESELLALVGDTEMVERVIIPGENHDAEIKRVEQSVAEIEAAIMSGDMPAASAGRMLGKLESKLEYLRSLPSTPDTTRDILLGKTYAQHWAELDTEGRGAFLRASKVKLYAAKDAEFAAISGALADAARDGDIPGMKVVPVGKSTVAISFGSLSRLIGAAKIG
jgi:site-specific DNA recombinase